MNVRGEIKLFDVKEVNKRINECPSRNISFDIAICRGMCEPCGRVIRKGKCDTVIEYFNELADKKTKACLDILAEN